MPLLRTLEIEPNNPATASIIWLHGLGADGHDFAPLVPELGLPQELDVRFIFPHASSIPVTINNSVVMPAWYDILEMGRGRKINELQLRESASAIHALINQELARGIDSQRILLAGFSQGGAVNYEAALTFNKPLGGLLALSTYFATDTTVQPHPANQQLPIQICHGTLDQVVYEDLGKQSMAALNKLGYNPRYQNYPMGHELCQPEIGLISQWIQQRLTD
ncbi:MAG: carboxylesterase [Motiliproteus sp.]